MEGMLELKKLHLFFIEIINTGKINTDKRCKVFPFTDFTSSLENSWIIDKWWSEEEKIELGISEKKDKLGLLDFSSLVEDMSISLKTFCKVSKISS